jgi:ATPase subunit of ABC transporter with duplicated ATPase domains
LRRALEATGHHRDTISQLQMFGLALDAWPSSVGDHDPLRESRTKLATAEKHIDSAHALILAVISDIEQAIASVEREKLPLEDQARVLRREVENLKEGAGAAARQLAGLREQVAQLDAQKAIRQQKLDRVARIQQQRSALLDHLDHLREMRSEERQRIAQQLTASLSPYVRVKIRQFAQLPEFVGAINNLLRGSGLRYNELSNALAATMSPRELAEAVENLDADFISKSAKISAERSARIITQLRESGTEGLISIALEDIADFELLDGTEFKSMNELSVGQRCTVVLSILLQHPDRVIIVDQPEDHLDNAFIVETLIEAIRSRSSSGQLIFSTHNANIPVLGEASRVARLASNGRRAFVVHAEPLDHPKSVNAIKTIMEGGNDAFRRRADFYRRFSNE